MRRLICIFLIASELSFAVDPKCLRLEQTATELVQALKDEKERKNLQLTECMKNCKPAEPLVSPAVAFGIGVVAAVAAMLAIKK